MQLTDQYYEKLTPHTRALLSMSAIARGDAAEANRLLDTYYDDTIAYPLRFQHIFVLSKEFFDKCVRHYNFIMHVSLLISNLKKEIKIYKKYEEEPEKSQLIEEDQKNIEILTEEKKKAIALLKGLFKGFKAFCDECELIYDDILATLSIEDCCYQIDFYLSFDRTPIDEEYAITTKNYFLKLWRYNEDAETDED